jgi:uncharacterized protein (DUF4415 family)
MSLAKQGKKNPKTPPKFEDQANIETTEEKPEISHSETEVKEQNSTPDAISELVTGVLDKPKPNPKRQISVYVDEGVAKEFEKWGKKHGKGSKSELINNFLKKALNV